MQITLSTPTYATDFVPPTQSPPASIELQGVIIEHGSFFVWLRCNGCNYTFVPEARTFLSFPWFQLYLLDELGLSITHSSQGRATSVQRKRAWRAAIRIAYERGLSK